MALKTKERPRRAAERKGILSAKTYSGLNKERLARRGGDRLIIKKGQTKTVQFLDTPGEMEEYDCHVWSEGKNKWNFVPCAGKKCPLCADEDEDVAKVSYRAAANVWSFDDKAVLVFEGGQEIFEKIQRRYEKRAKSFLKRTWEISQIEGKRTSWDIEQGDESPVDPRPLQKKKIDLKKWIQKNMDRFFKDSEDKPKSRRSALDDDDDDYDDDDDTYTLRDLKKMSEKQLRRAAKDVGVKPHSSNTRITMKRILAAQDED